MEPQNTGVRDGKKRQRVRTDVVHDAPLGLVEGTAR